MLAFRFRCRAGTAGSRVCTGGSGTYPKVTLNLPAGRALSLLYQRDNAVDGSGHVLDYNTGHGSGAGHTYTAQ